MKGLLRFFAKYYILLLFLFLEGVSLTLIIKYNSFQSVKFLSSSNVISGSIYEAYTSITDYFTLKKQNEILAQENARLTEKLIHFRYDMADSTEIDSFNINLQYELISAKVISNSVDKHYNYITLNKGLKDGIHTEMGVINHNGLVGVVINSTNRYSTVMSLLNRRFVTSAKLKSNYFGPTNWDGNSRDVVNLNEIPFHVDVETNDSVFTSGYSDIFPEGIYIGQVIETSRDQSSNFQDIRLKPAVDFQKIYTVQVIDNNNIEALDSLKQYMTDED